MKQLLHRNRLVHRLRVIERATRRDDPEVSAALAQRWSELPEHVRTPGQLLGRRLAGCEGTHGVFPACDFACKPCYHSVDANRVPIDGPHTIATVEAQMEYFRAHRGPVQHAQLIGGEVSLLSPEDHASVVDVMRQYGRMPMSFTHGDFDYDYLEKFAVRPDGTRRFDAVSFAVHIDSTMYGRRGIEHPTDELDLNPYRARFCAMFDRLEAEHGVRSHLAHNMTVTPGNLEQIPEVIAACRTMGFRVMSFQPAAYVGNEVRWREDFRAMTDDDVWDQIQLGAGRSLPYKAVQVGDLRCNRTTWGFFAGDRYVPLLDDAEPGDLEVRDALFEAFPRSFLFVSRPLQALRVARAIARRPSSIALAAGWARRALDRAGGVGQLRQGIQPLTFVMHNFMDARDVAPAWELLQRGETSDDPTIRATQERLQACSYGMAHPESDQIVPACAQHGVLDPEENRQLVTLLASPPRRPARVGSVPDSGQREGDAGAAGSSHVTRLSQPGA